MQGFPKALANMFLTHLHPKQNPTYYKAGPAMKYIINTRSKGQKQCIQKLILLGKKKAFRMARKVKYKAVEHPPGTVETLTRIIYHK